MTATPAPLLSATAEGQRLLATRRGEGWRRWGSYVSDRQWGTVREDYSPGGTAWEYFPHDHARSRAYRWGEDGLAGFSDEQQRWCLGLALWNGRDPIIKERLFGLTNNEGNHGEDVKEHYAFLDGTPTHSYMRMLYKYPQAAFPYARLVEENARRGKQDREFELHDTGVFARGAYFDVTVEYAKAGTDDILLRIAILNRGSEPADLHVLPQLWARNTWSWSPGHPRARITRLADGGLLAQRPATADLRLDALDGGDPVFCENDTNGLRLFGDQSARGPFKDGINDYVVHGDAQAISRQGGSKAAFIRRLTLAGGEQAQLRLRLRPAELGAANRHDFDAVVARRRDEADEFYGTLQQGVASAEERAVQRQALAGLLWCKQYYHFDVERSFDGDPLQPPPPPGRTRNAEWRHLNNADIVSMPDSWEYPWYASWDLAFQSVTAALIDPDFAKAQLLLLTRDWYMHPNGQLPAYEWAFGDANPPVHAWAALRVYEADRALSGSADTAFLERIFQKLLLNFAWWVNRKDAGGRNIFQGGFLGLDNVGVFDRSAPLPTGGTMDQSDGTAWMAAYALNMMRIAIELAFTNPVYEDMASKFFEHFLAIAQAMTEMGGMGLWNEEDGFFYDVLSLPDGRHLPLKLHSIVGLIPIFAVEVLEPEVFRRLPVFAARARWFLMHRPHMASLVSRWSEPGRGERNLLSLLRGHRLKCLLRRALDTAEFLSPFGIRSLSKAHGATPYRLDLDGGHYEIGYEPGEAEHALFGGNSNWRGPVWFPVNMLLIESLRRFHTYYGPDFTVEYPVGSGRTVTLEQAAEEVSRRLVALFLPAADGRRPFWGDDTLAATDPAFRDALMFHEHFHGETGRGLGAAHQTGWTALVANLIASATPDAAGKRDGAG